MARLAMRVATITSGHNVPVPSTPAAASRTARLPRTSLREQIQAERRFDSALLANAGVAVMLYRFRSAESNLRSAWICSRNDVLGNLAVLLAAAGVLGTGTLWPDVIVATLMASLAIQGSWTVIRQSLGELNDGASRVTRPETSRS